VQNRRLPERRDAFHLVKCAAKKVRFEEKPYQFRGQLGTALAKFQNNHKYPGQVIDMQKSKYNTCKLLIAIVLVSTSWSDASGTTWYPADPSVASVQTAINSASDGDTVIVPAGSATWTTTVACRKGIAITGAGIGQTVITSSLTSTSILSFDGTKAFRLSGITFLDTAPGYGMGMVTTGAGNTWRIHDCEFGTSTSKLHGTGMTVWGTVGLIDHCTFNLAGGGSTGMWIFGGTAGSAQSDAIWNQTVVWGTADFVFIEDCTFTTALPNVANAAIDQFGGAKVCFRHNNVTNLTVGGHGYDSGGYRSPFANEIYNNVVNSTAHMASFLQSRGGASLWHDNTCTDSSGYSNRIQLDAYREQPELFPGGQLNANSGAADGTKAVDGNLSGLVENPLIPPPAYKGYAYPLHDQCGRTGPTVQGVSSCTQTLSPVYAWNNTINGSPMLAGGNVGAQVIVANRDYYNSAKAGYTPYTYPHPLVGGSNAPSAPANLRIQ
jgi:hypothetical protein